MKRNVKQILCLVLAFVMVLGVMPTVAHAAPVKDEGKYSAKIEKDVYAQKKQEWALAQVQNPTLLSLESNTIRNSYIQCCVHANGGFNIGTSDGDCLLFAYPDGNTSNTLIRINSRDYIFSEYVTDITYSANNKTAVATALIHGVEVTQTLSIVKNPNSNTENVISVHYACRNTTDSSVTIGIRIMMDTMLGSNDGAPFKINGQSVTHEREYRGNSIPKTYQAMDSLTNPSLTATGYFFYKDSEKPDKVQFARWPDIVGAPWNYEVSSSRAVTDDSAVAAYFNEKSIAPGGTRSVITYYGAHNDNAAGQYPGFNYDNSTYSQTLAEMCARLSAYAYQDYKYDSNLDVFYNVEDAGKKEVKKNNHSKVLVDYLKKQGYKDIVSENYKNPTEDSATYTISRKEVNHNGVVRDLILIVIRGTNKDEWQGNMNVTGTSYDSSQNVHDSFQNGARQIWSRLMRYINTLNGDSKSDNDVNNAMVLITGHSRGGAVGNLLAYELTYGDASQIDESEVYAYLFAVPNVTTEDVSGMSNVFNFCFTDDFVPSMPLGAWNYGKYGTTFTATATNLRSSDFLNRQNSSLTKSLKAKEMENRVSYDAARTTAVIDYVAKNWTTVKQYYTKEPKGNTIVDSLYDFMHDLVAPAAMGNLAVGARLLTFTSDKNPNKNSYTKIANFFTDGASQRASINDTHNMFTYYNALKTGCFNTATATANTLNNLLLSTEGAEDHSALEQEALIAFANTGSNLEILDWDLEDISTWSGITLDENGCVTEIDLSYLSLTGGLDLTAFNCLNYVDVSGNALDSLILPEAETSVLTWLDCSYNNLEDLDITGQPLELLCCSENFLDADAMEAAASDIPMASCSPQNSTEPIVYSDADCAVLREKVLLNGEIWDTTADPGTWYGVTWEEIDGIRYVVGLDLTGAGLSGELDVSGLAHLSAITCSDNDIVSIDASGCDELEFLNCCSNAISDLQLSPAANLTNFYCADNYLTEEEIAGAGAELTHAGHQRILADASSFCDAEYDALLFAAEILEEDLDKPGEWFFTTWEKHDGVYHVVRLDLSGIAELSGELDLSVFTHLAELDCSGTDIESVILPDHMSALNEYAFYDCTSLTEVHLPANLTEIGDYAFYGCSALGNITFSAELKKIGDGAFAECEALTAVYFPATLEELGNEAFMNNAAMRAAYFTGNAPACGENAFMFSSVDFTVYYLTGTVGWDADVWSAYITDEIGQLSILTYPGKTVFFTGEELDTSGLSLLLLNRDGTHLIISEGFDITCEPLAAPGVYTVVVGYQGFETEYEVSVRTLSIRDAYIDLDEYTYDYTGSEITPQVFVYYEDIELIEGVDYTLSYENNVYPGIALIHVSGIQEYTDVVTLEFEIINEVTYYVDDWRELESEHDYLSYSDLTWIFESGNEEVEFLDITFDENTEFEEGYDYLEIYDGDDELVGTYTGVELAGQTITVYGNRFTLYMHTDSSVTYWGFKVTDVRAAGDLPVPDHIAGDINGDGAVNNKDLTRLFQYLSDWDVEVEKDALDINGDGAVNNKDLTRLFQYLSDWDVDIY